VTTNNWFATNERNNQNKTKLFRASPVGSCPRMVRTLSNLALVSVSFVRQKLLKVIIRGEFFLLSFFVWQTKKVKLLMIDNKHITILFLKRQKVDVKY
jgi:hypothetical protein